MGLDIFTLGSSKTYTRESLLGGGAVVGKNVTVSSITSIEGGNRVTFSYTLDNGTVKTSTMDVMNGASITSVEVNSDNTLTCTLSDGSTVTTANKIKTVKGDKGDPFTYSDFTQEQLESLKVKGDAGVSPTITENADNTDKIYKLDITTADTTFTTPNLKGADGQGGSGSGEENKIEVIKVNGVEQAISADKSVDITVPDAYDDTEVKSQIQAVANGLMDSVGYSADYKTIDIIAKNGVKKSVDVAPIISHASVTELADVDTTNKDNGKALVYNSATSKHEYADVSGTDEKVKMDVSTDAKYLGELLDNVTITNENGELKVKKLDGQEVTITEINYLKGLTMNVMDLVNMFSNGGVKIINTPVATYAELLTLDKSAFIEGISYLVYVLADENHDNAKTTYLVDKDSETPTYFGFADSHRDFVTNPIDLATEITGKLGISNMDSDAIKALFTVDDTYKTETATNNAFSTHGAKALYDELLLAISGKANDSDLTTHKDDANIHVSTTEKDSWNGKADASELTAHTDNVDVHVTTDDKTAWNKAQENVIESVKVNNEEITPDENKAVNIDLSNHAEHDEIVGENLIPYPYAQPERTTNGITFTFADDGSIIANGTATADSDFSVSVRTNFGTDKAFMLNPGTYAITGCPEGGSDSTYRIHVQFGDKTGVKYNLKADYGKGFVFEVTEEHAKYACQIQCHVQRGYTVTDLVFKPMLVLGSVLKEYQPYKLSRDALRTDIDDVTELASRIDNQFSTASGDSITVTDSVDGNIIELGIKGNSFQNNYIGKNLIAFPYYDTTKTVNGITFTVNSSDGSVTANGTATSNAIFFFRYRENNTLTAGNYVFSGTPKGGSKTTYYQWFGIWDGTSNIYGVYDVGDSANVTLTDELCEQSLVIGCYVYSGATVSNLTFYPQLELGDTATEYEVYCGGCPAPNPSYPQPINSVGDDGSLVVKSCGKNLFNANALYKSYNYSGITCTLQSDGSLKLSGTSTAAINMVMNKFTLKAGTYTYSTPGRVKAGLCLYSTTEQKFIAYNAKTFTIDKDSVLDIRVQFSASTDVDEIVYTQFEVGEVATEYEPYKESTSTIPLSEPLRAIGDVKDEITYQDGKWGVLRRTGQYVIDGTENLILPSTNISDYGISVRLGDYTNILKGISTVSGNTADMVTNYLRCRELDNIIYYHSGTIVDYGSGIYRTSGNIWLSFGASDIEKMGITKDVNSVKTWLSSHNITVHYPLGSPVFEPFTDQTLPYLSTYDGVTNISNDDALSAEMTVKYPTTDASGVGSKNEAKIAELTKDTDDKLNEVKVLGWSVPAECPIKNYTDSDGVFHQRVGRVEISNIVANESMFGTNFRLVPPTDCKKGTHLNGYCKLYQTVDSADYNGWNTYRDNKSIGFLSTYEFIIVKDDTYSDETAFKNAMKGVYLYYELATEITKTIDGNEAISKVNELLDDIVTIEKGEEKQSSNLLGFDDFTETKNGCTLTIKDNLITVQGTPTTNTEFTVPQKSPNFTNGQTLYMKTFVQSGELTSSTIAYMHSSGKILLNFLHSSVIYSGTLTEDQVRTKFRIGSTATDCSFYIMVTDNEEECKTYQEYGSTINIGGSVVLNEQVEIPNFDTKVKDIVSSIIPDENIDTTFDAEIEDTIQKTFDNSYGECLRFAYISDTHTYPNYDEDDSSTKQYKAEIEHIKTVNESIPFDFLLHCGDFVNTQWLWAHTECTDSQYQRMVHEYCNLLQNTGIKNIFTTIGNHDGGIAENGAECSSFKANFRATQQQNTNSAKVVRDGVNPYYYVDYDNLKLRCLFIATNMDSSTSDWKGIQYSEALWLKNVLEAIPNDYNVLMFGHIPLNRWYTKNSGAGSTQCFIDICNGFCNHTTVDNSGTSLDCDFTSKTGKILAYICGHYHGDSIVLPEDEHSVLEFAEVTIASGSYLGTGVITTGDWYDLADAPSDRTYGTINQDAWDSVVYNKTENKIYFTRFGAGDDRVLELS